MDKILETLQGKAFYLSKGIYNFLSTRYSKQIDKPIPDINIDPFHPEIIRQIITYHREQFTTSVGMEPIFWLTSANTALLAITITTVWSAAGYYSIIILAGLQTIPRDLLEAAEIDGAGRVLRFIHIILPYLKPTIFFILVVGTINSIGGFPPFLIMTGGGPGNATRVIGLMIYEYCFVHLKMGVGSAISVVLLVIILGITLIQKKVLSKGGEI